MKQARGNPTAIPGRVIGPILYGAKHPLGTRRHRGVAVGDHARRLQEAARDVAAAEARAAVRRRRSHRGRRSATRSRSRRSPAWTGAAPKPPALPAPKTMAGRIFFVHVPERRAVDGDACSSFGPQAHRAGLLREHDDVVGVRRQLHEPAQHEPARGQGLLVRRARRASATREAVRHAHRRARRCRPTRRTRRCSRSIARSKELAVGQARRSPRTSSSARRPNAIARAPGPVRDRAGRARPVPQPRVLRPPTRLLQYVRRQGRQGHRGAGQGSPRRSTSSRPRRCTSSSATATRR